MATYTVTDPITRKTLQLTGESPPTESELNEIFGAFTPKPPDIEPISAEDELVALGYTKEEATKALANDVGISVKDQLIKPFTDVINTPPQKAESVEEYIGKTIPESAMRTAYGVAMFPYELLKSFEEPIRKTIGAFPQDPQGMVNGLKQIWEATGENVQGFGQFFGEAIGVKENELGFWRFNFQALKDKYGVDPIGGLLGLAAWAGFAKKGKKPTGVQKEYLDTLSKEQRTVVNKTYEELITQPDKVIKEVLQDNGVDAKTVGKFVEDIKEPEIASRPEPTPKEPRQLLEDMFANPTEENINALMDAALKYTGKTKVYTGPKGGGRFRREVQGWRTFADAIGEKPGKPDPRWKEIGFTSAKDFVELSHEAIVKKSIKDIPDLDFISEKAIDSIITDEINRGADIASIESQRGSFSLEKQSYPNGRFKFENPELEQRYFNAHGMPKEPLWDRITETFDAIKASATRSYKYLPNTGEFAELQFALKNLEKGRGIASHKTVRGIQGITENLKKDANLYNMFERKALLDDLKETMEKGKEIPFGFTEESLVRELSLLDTEIAKSPEIQWSINKRQMLWDAVKEDYQKAFKAIGFNKADFNNKSYFRHMVLDYARAKGIAGTGKKLSVPTGRGFLKERKGSGLDINTDYLQAEWEVMSQMMYDTQIAKVWKVIEGYDIGKKGGIPEGYVEYQPKEGNTFYMTDTIPAKLAEELRYGALAEIGITADDIGQALAVGKKRKSYVIKEEIAKTLEEFGKGRTDNAVSQAAKTLLTKWKQWQLISPRRMFKYNIRNLTGDSEGVFLGNPEGFKKVPQAVSELYDLYAKNKDMSANLKEWFERGGMESTLQFQEMGDINNLKIFKDLADKHGGLASIPKATWDKYWSFARLSTDFRESILRYSNYLDFLEQMEKGGGKPKNFGFSIPEEIMGLKDIKNRAFWLSNDLLGAYDRLSIAGQYLREHLYPFWSWQEVNFKRYVRGFKNAVNDGHAMSFIGYKALGSLAKSPYTAYRVGSFLFKATAFWSALEAYNNFVFPDEENDLSIDERARPHVILGRDKNGKVLSFNRIGSLGDFLQWFGLDVAPKYVRDWMQDKVTLKEIAEEMAQSPVNKVVSGFTPFAKTPVEIATRRSTYPDIFNPQTIRNRGLYIAQSLGLENEYKAMAGVPSEGYVPSVPKLFMYVTDPGQSAYSAILEEKNRFLKKVGKSAEGFWFTDKGNALYNMKLAIRYKDEDAFNKYASKYVELGGTNRGMRDSLKSAHPLGSLSKRDRNLFVQTLNADDKRKLERAIKFYQEVLLGQK